jgi:CheY-like chemotaxis protein
MALWTLKPYRILVVDDFSDMRSYIRGMLAAYGAVDIRLPKNGDEAVTALQAERHDLVLCDDNLGDGRDGQQVLEQA